MVNENVSKGANSVSGFRILEFNANSLGTNPKRSKVLNFMRKKNPDFLIVTDSRICPTIENVVREEWGGKCIFNSFSSQARGVAILLKKGNLAKILDEFRDDGGNIMAILIEYDEKKILLEGLYGPNIDSPDFYESQVFRKIEEWEPSFSIFVGDWNVALNKNLDTKNYLQDNNPNARQVIKDKMQEHNLIDIFRDLNPDSKIFTWQKYNQNKFARLDYFLISSSLAPYVQDVKIIPSFCSDHSPVIIDIDFTKFKRGRGFWKFNNSLLKDKDFMVKIKDIIKRVCMQYAIVNDDPNFYINATEADIKTFLDTQTPESLQSLNMKTNPQLFLDTLLMEIRRETISFSIKNKRKNQAKEQLLMHDIEALERELINSNDQTFININQELQNKRQEMEAIYAHQAHGAYVRARAKYKCEGEKPTKLFMSLEKHNSVQKYIPKLCIEKNGVKTTIYEQESIETETCDYYEDLFASKDIYLQNQTIEEFLGNESSNSCPKISQSQKVKMEGILTMEELVKYMKKAKNNVSPGSTGFTNEFYKFFLRDLKIFMLNSINHSYQTGMLSVTQRLGIITLIPKGDKDKSFLKNWRPLTLLNSMYKIISGCISERIKPSLGTIIHSDQKGFVSDRYIGEAVRTTYDIMDWAKENNKTGLILLIDFEKAYDSISFNYINKVLKFFNFGDSLIKWVNILLNNFTAVINHCGNISKKFDIQRGCRQGDPIASYLFIMTIEILAHKLRTEKKIVGFKIGNISQLLELYADDCSIFLEPNSTNLRETCIILNNFYALSGLKIQVTKTKAIWFGAGWNNKEKLCPDLTLDWDTEFRLLGIDFDSGLTKMERNLETKIEEIRKLFNCWIYRNLTPYGRIVIVKTLALSKLSHAALVIPTLNKVKIKEIEGLMFKFIWGNKPDKVARDDSKLSERAGGLGMIDVYNFWQSFKFSWIRRLLSTSSFWPAIFLETIHRITGEEAKLDDFLQLGPAKLTYIGKKIHNKFWGEVLLSVAPILQGAIFSNPKKILLSTFWDNQHICKNNKPIKKTMYPCISDKIVNIADFFKIGSNSMMTFEEFKNCHQIELAQNTFLELHYIVVTAIRSLGILETNLPKLELPFQPIIANIATLTLKGCNSYYKILRKKSNLTNNIRLREEKWHLELGTVYGIEYWNKIYNFTTDIKNDNYLKWLHFQTVRNSLFSNYRVNKIKSTVSPLCSTCLEIEKVSHIFWSCAYVQNLWRQINLWLDSFDIKLPLVNKHILFGFIKEPPSSKINFTILSVKNYIWKNKFRDAQLSLTAFQRFFKRKLEDLKHSYEYIEKPCLFDQWNDIFNFLSL